MHTEKWRGYHKYYYLSNFLRSAIINMDCECGVLILWALLCSSLGGSSTGSRITDFGIPLEFWIVTICFFVNKHMQHICTEIRIKCRLSYRVNSHSNVCLLINITYLVSLMITTSTRALFNYLVAIVCVWYGCVMVWTHKCLRSILKFSTS